MAAWFQWGRSQSDQDQTPQTLNTVCSFQSVNNKVQAPETASIQQNALSSAPTVLMASPLVAGSSTC